MSESQPPPEDRSPRTPLAAVLRELHYVLIALFITFVIVTFGVTFIGVSGSSMEPNLDGGREEHKLELMLSGDRVLIPKFHTWLRRAGLVGPYKPGQIVGLREPVNTPSAYEGLDKECAQARFGLTCRSFFIKRVMAGPGDSLAIVRGQVIVNGHAVDQEFITGTGEIVPEQESFPVIWQENGEVTGFGVLFPFDEIYPFTLIDGEFVYSYPPEDERIQFFYSSILENLAPIPANSPEGEPLIHDVVVPDGYYFVMGDNRTRFGSEDSRVFGLVPEIDIVGPATAVIWPPFRDGKPNMRRLTPPEAFKPAWR